MGKPNLTAFSLLPDAIPVSVTRNLLLMVAAKRQQWPWHCSICVRARLITSPYIRALETAEIIATHLSLPITVNALVAERFCFTCDIGSPLAELRTRWPAIAFDHLGDPWWPQVEETVELIYRRSRQFRRQILSEAWRETAVVTHWGFIRALTGATVPNGSILRIDPTRLDHEPEMVFVADTG